LTRRQSKRTDEDLARRSVEHHDEPDGGKDGRDDVGGDRACGDAIPALGAAHPLRYYPPWRSADDGFSERRDLASARPPARATAAGRGGATDAPPQAADGMRPVPEAITSLKPMTAGVTPIADDERKARIAKAQQLMTHQKIDAIFIEGTTSCFYYTGMRWGQSERTFGVVIPAKGPIAYVCPGFEEDRARELIKPAFGDEVRVWQGEARPYKAIVGVVNDR